MVAADTPTPPPSAQEAVISWEEVAGYEGQTVTVAGHIVDTYNSGKVVFLNFDQDYATTFKVVIFPDAWSLFPAPPEEYYRDKVIQVTGQVKMYQNAPEIIVEQPDQIEIME
jgi:DNA/RNA endonuclease YhcR with UshA esterase domain